MHASVKSGIDEGMIEQAESKLDAQHRANRPVEIGLGQGAFVHTIDQRLLKDGVIEIIELHVDAGPDGHTRGIFCRRGNAMYFVETLDRAQIREHKPLKSPFVAKDLLEQKGIRGNWDAVDFVIASHGRHGVSLTESWFKRPEHDRAQ